MAYIDSLARFGSRPGLERILALLTRLGDPQKDLRYIHLAGTNGKGSTATMIAAALTGAGYHTGAYLSPPIEHFGERIQLDGAFAPEEAVADAILSARDAAEGLEITDFEVITAAAFLVFRSASCDFVVLETGLGGRFDATNVIPPPLVSVITSVSFDHVEQLGHTLEQIAAEKCGIIKPGCTAVTYPGQEDAVARVIAADCAEKHVPLVVPSLATFAVSRCDERGTAFVYDNTAYETQMIGAHFAKNAVTAIEALRALRTHGYTIPEDAVRSGIAHAQIPARMERIADRPLAYVDGAHNPDCMARLCETLDTVFAGRPLITVMAMLSDKDYPACVPMIASRSAFFIATTSNSPRALSAKDLALCASGHTPVVTIAAHRKTALYTAIRTAISTGGVILCCGSFTFLGECKQEMRTFLQLNAQYNII